MSRFKIFDVQRISKEHTYYIKHEPTDVLEVLNDLDLLIITSQRKN